MIHHPYLIALALIKQEGKRYLPLGGKSLRESIDPMNDPGEIGRDLAQQVLLRVFEKSDSKPLNRAYGEKSLIIIQVPMNSMQDKLPIIKANWLNSGDNEKLIEELNILSDGIWTISFSRDQGVNYSNLN